MPARRIVVLPGDGIGPEVTGEAVRVLQEVAHRGPHSFEFEWQLIGGAALRAGMLPLPGETRDACISADAVLLGAVGDPAFDDRPAGGRPESGLLALRQAMGVYANLRPARVHDALASATPLKAEIARSVDMVIVRELTGGLYFGEPRSESPDAALNTLRYSRFEIERIARTAFDAARRRRRRVLSVDKANVLETSRLWRRIVSEVAADYPDIALEHIYVDACAMKMIIDPGSIDVLLTENLFGDILSDEAGALCGSLGLLPSASLGEGPGLFEPVHGSAPSIAGQGVANPIGAIASAAMLLRDGLGLVEEGNAVDAAIGHALASGARTADIAGPADRAVSTSAMTDAIIAAMAGRIEADSGRLTPAPTRP